MFTSESTSFKTRYPKAFRVAEKSNLTCLIWWIHQSGGVQVAQFFANFFNKSVLDRVFCIELEKYRPFELGSIIFRSKGPDLRKKLGGTYKREFS